LYTTVKQVFKRHFYNAMRAPSESCFGTYWEAMLAGIKGAAKYSDAVHNYLVSIWKARQRWAYYSRAGVLTLGICATQRVEGFFGKIKAELTTSTTLCHLFDKLDQIFGR
jgi:hypothetical protein